MDLLQTYQNESDNSNTSSEDDTEYGVISVNTGSRKQEHALQQHDYFSLQVQSDDEEEDISVESNKPKTVVVNDLEIEVPQSTFWMKEDISGKNISESSRIYSFERNVESIPISGGTDKPKKNLHKRPVAYSIKRKKTQILDNPSLHESSPFYNTMSAQSNTHNGSADMELTERKLPKVSQTKSYQSKGNIQETLSVNENMKRKIFFIHGKLAPILNKRLKSKCPINVEKEWSAHQQVMNRICWNKAEYSHLLLSACMDSTVKVWNVWTRLDTCVQTLKCHDKAVKDAQWEPSGCRILSCGYDRSCVLSCVESGTAVSQLQHKDYVFCCKYHPCNPNVIITGSTNNISTWDIRTPSGPTSQYRYKDRLGQIQDLIFSHDGETVFSCSDIVTQNSADRNIMAWDYRTSCVLSNQIYEERYTCNRLKLHPQDTQSFLAQSQGGYIAIFSTKRPFKMNKTKRFEGHKLLGRNIGFDVSVDGDMILSGSCDKRLCCYNYRTSKLFKTLQTGIDYTDVAFHPVLPSTVASAGWDGQIQLLH